MEYPKKLAIIKFTGALAKRFYEIKPYQRNLIQLEFKNIKQK